METIDAIVRRILTEKVRLGLFERPYVDEGAIELQAPATVALAREVARQAMVVLENNGVLPLDPGRGQRIALIGPTADDPMALLCGYSFPVHLILNDAGETAAQVVTPRAAFEKAFGAGGSPTRGAASSSRSASTARPVFPGDVEKSTSLEQASPVSRRTDLIPAAVACARAADVAVVCVGDLAGLFQTGTVGEGSDADSLDLPGVQQQLLEAVVATGKPVVVVLTSGRPYNLGGLEDKVAAFVMAFAGGQEGGPALVDVLTGEVEPSGRLTVSVPRNVGAVPYYYNHKMKSAGTPIARHFGSRYPFGHGLGYTTFEFADLALDAAEVDAGDRRDPPALRRAQHRVARRGRGAAALRAGPPRLGGAAGQGAEGLRPGRAAGGRVGAGHLRGAHRHALLHRAWRAGASSSPGSSSCRWARRARTSACVPLVEVTGAARTLGREWRMESRCVVER